MRRRFSAVYSSVLFSFGLAWEQWVPLRLQIRSTFANGDCRATQFCKSLSRRQFTTYDISFFDSQAQLDYVADRTNASVDVFSAATNQA